MVAPWFGDRFLRLGPRKWIIQGKLPKDRGWYDWKTDGRKCSLLGEASEWDDGKVKPFMMYVGTLVGDLLVKQVEPYHMHGGPEALKSFPRVHLLPQGLDHFARVRAGAAWQGGPLIFMDEEFPLGPEDEVRDRYLERESLDGVSGVTPALELAFRMLVWRREREEKRREEIRIAREREQRMKDMQARLGDGAIRREVAKLDFNEAAKAALAVGGAELIEARPSANKGEFVVRYRIDGGRYECVCDDTMHVIDAGICLQDHDTGEKGDTYFTLESLPGVTRQAMAEGAAIWRHV